jgi:hypothetical protein
MRWTASSRRGLPVHPSSRNRHAGASGNVSGKPNAWRRKRGHRRAFEAAGLFVDRLERREARATRRLPARAQRSPAR